MNKEGTIGAKQSDRRGLRVAATAPAADRGVVSTRPPPPRKLWALTSCIRYPMLRNKLPQNPAAERKRVSF